jgi:thiosulfate sulfurtransferase
MAFKHLSVPELKAMMSEQTLTIIDIRDPQSYSAGHIENSLHIDNQTVDRLVSQTDHSIPLVVCCYHGNSSQGAADYLNEQGFVDVYSLDGGYQAWLA